MRKRTPSEIKAYGDGYATAYKEFCHLLDRHEKDKAIRKMKIFVDAVALTVETATDTADTPQTDLSVEEFVEGVKNLKMEVKRTDCEACKHYKLACELFSEVCKYEPTTQMETKNSNLTFEKDTPQTESTGSPIGDYRDGVGAWQTDCGWGEPK